MKFSDLDKSEKLLKKREDLPDSKKEIKEDVSNTLNSSIPLIDKKENKIQELPSKPPETASFSNKMDEGIKPIDNDKIEFDEVILREKSHYTYSNLISIVSRDFRKISEGLYYNISDDFFYASQLILDEVRGNGYFANFLKYLTPANYLYSHALNLAIITCGIMNELKYSDDEIKKAIVSALFIDIGMLNYRLLTSVEREFTDIERETIKNHLKDGINIASKVFSYDEEMKKFVCQAINLSHERYDGSGYFKLSGDEIQEVYQIISISDFYEALTHKRSYREAFDEHEVLSGFIGKTRRLFHHRAIKGLISFLTLYPCGSFVKLSSGEVGRVLFINKSKPLKPIVRIEMDANFREIGKRVINLADSPLLYIEGYISLKELSNKNPGFVKREKIKWLWIEW
ncbi:MAG: HD domain-containing protein [Elusimicrobiota bacterium]